MEVEKEEGDGREEGRVGREGWEGGREEENKQINNLVNE